jgi:hypothetical protein
LRIGDILYPRDVLMVLVLQILQLQLQLLWLPVLLPVLLLGESSHARC